LAIAAVAGGLGHSTDYAIRIVLTAAALALVWRRLQPIVGPRSVAGSMLLGAAAGLAGVALWIALVLPFHDASAGEPFPPGAFALRVIAATVLVPFIEELLFRGYVLGMVTQWQEARRAGVADPLSVALDERSVREIEPGAWAMGAVVVSSVAFAVGHSPAEYAAAFAYGLLMAWLWIRRGDLVAPITAHAVTNLALYLYIYQTGSWGLW
jgi:membrane protease YdiL (CAAX protease family)